MAGWSVLFQVEAQSRQFAVWHQDQVVKLLPIKGLVGQEMALDDYLQYTLQEALATPRRASARRSKKVRQPPLWGKAVVSRLRKGTGESGAICYAGSPCV